MSNQRHRSRRLRVMVIMVAAFAGYSRTLSQDVATNIAVVADRAMPQVQVAVVWPPRRGVEAARQQVVAATAVAGRDDGYPIDTPPGRPDRQAAGAAWCAPSHRRATGRGAALATASASVRGRAADLWTRSSPPIAATSTTWSPNWSTAAAASPSLPPEAIEPLRRGASRRRSPR